MNLNAATRLTATALFALVITALACSDPAPNTGPPPAVRSGTQGVPLAQPSYTTEPLSAIPVEPDPTRAAMTHNMIENFAKRITDLTYTAAIGRIAISSPEQLPDHIAAREHHSRCVNETYQDARLLASPERPLPDRNHQFTDTSMAVSLENCLRGQTNSWKAYRPFDRAAWIERILESATRAKNPAEHYRTIHPQAKDNDQWVQMYLSHRQCHDLITPQAEAIAVMEEPIAVTDALTRAVRNVDHCMATVTGQDWQEQPGPPQTSEPPSNSTPDP